jgi:CRISPR-associated endonuclease/helicase Cas3
VVEAGVDLDFPVVFRAIGPLDRIVQAAGRCNREGTLDGLGQVVVFEPREGGMPRGEYASAVGVARTLLKEDVDLHKPDTFRRYFSDLYRMGDQDAKGIQRLRERLDYPEVATQFRFIDSPTEPVIVEYEERDPATEEARRRMMERIRREERLRPGDQRRLQPYTVGLFSHDLRDKEWMLEEIAEGVRVWTESYDQVRGISVIRDDPADLVWGP